MNLRLQFCPRIAQSLLLLAALISQFSTAFAQGTAFTYQGRLNEGANPANGFYDFQFALYDGPSDPLAVVSVTNTLVAVPISNGLFTVSLDFGDPGSIAIFDGQQIWLGIAVRTNTTGAGGYTALAPRMMFTPTPYAIFAGNAGSASSATALTGKLAASQITGTIASSNIGVGTITGSNLAPGAAAANLGGSGALGVPSTGIVLSEKEINPSLLNAGFLPIGTPFAVSGEIWTNIPPGPPATGAFNPGRFGHKAVWTGSLVLIIGGSPDNAGLRYSPSANTWSVMTKTGAPAIGDAVDVAWTGTLLLVWDAYHRTGGRYNPATDTWTAMSTVNAPHSRDGEASAWTGSSFVILGGISDNYYSPFMDGGRYNPTTDTWTTTSTNGAPVARRGLTAVWSGTEIIGFGGLIPAETNSPHAPPFLVWEGYVGIGDGGRYNPASDTWALVSATARRFGHTAIWTGSRMIVYGGFDHDGTIGDCQGGCPSPRSFPSPIGQSYNPANNSWTAISTTFAPPGRANHSAVWDGTHMLVWGGQDASDFPAYLSDGGTYTPGSDTWTAIAAVALTPRSGHSSVWTGTQMVIWGGKDNNGAQLSDGQRYTLSANTWSATTVPPSSGEPSGRSEASYVWTGNQLIVWGGVNGSSALRSGGIYTPNSGWINTPDIGAPSARVHHTAVWTGTDMIVWGGQSYGALAPVNTGARFNVASNRWFPISQFNAPRARAYHSAVWTGTEMIVWGGYDFATNILFPTFLVTGGRYNPALDTWRPITNNLAISGFARQVAVWTGTNMLVWGGFNSSGGLSPTVTFFNVGFSYDPATNLWNYLPVSPLLGRRSHTGVWSGKEMIIWGGYTANGATNDGARYNPASNTWTMMPQNNGMQARLDHTAVWADSKGQMILWGGTDNTTYYHDGAIYDPLTDKLTTLTNNNAGIYSRSLHGAEWTGSSMIVLNGFTTLLGSPTNFSDGASFTPNRIYYLYQKP